MNGFKILSTCAALVLPMAEPAASRADPHGGGKGNSATVHAGGELHAGKSYHHRGRSRGSSAGAPTARFSSDNAGYRGTFISGSVVGAMGFYDNGYYEGGAVPVVPDPGGDAVGYCMQIYKSYDQRSGTYLGYDGQRHPCP